MSGIINMVGLFTVIIIIGVDRRTRAITLKCVYGGTRPLLDSYATRRARLLDALSNSQAPCYTQLLRCMN